MYREKQSRKITTLKEKLALAVLIPVADIMLSKAALTEKNSELKDLSMKH